MTAFRNFTRRLFLVLNVLTGMLFLLACCNRFLHPDRWWFIALLAFIFPLLLILLIIFFFSWLLGRSRYCLISAGCLLIGWQSIHAFFGFNLASADFSKKDPAAIRILTWNVRSWDEFSVKKNDPDRHNIKMMDLIGQENADVVCIQEFYEPGDSTKSNVKYFIKNLGYPYCFFSRDFHNKNLRYQTGTAIFSRYPVLATSLAYFNRDSLRQAERLISVDIQKDSQIVRIFTTHLQSVLFKARDFRNVEIVRNAEDSMLEASRSLAKKLKNALGLRGYQADTVRKRLDASPYPSVICGDFNDVPNSYTYFHIRGNFQDAFIAKCFGIGRSYIHISPTLRIDYILPSKEFEILQTMKMIAPYSDHRALITDLRLRDRKG